MALARPVFVSGRRSGGLPAQVQAGRPVPRAFDRLAPGATTIQAVLELDYPSFSSSKPVPPQSCKYFWPGLATGASQQLSRLWRREEKVTGLGWENSALSVHPIRRKLRPVKQWCDSNPNLSMVPLSGGEDIGEADKGFVVDSLSRLEECIQRGSRAVRIGHEPANAFVHSHDLPKDQIHQVQNDPTGGKDAGH